MDIASAIKSATVTCLKTTKYLYDLQQKYKNAPIVVVSICSESTVISASLAKIQSLLLQRLDLSTTWKSQSGLGSVLDTTLTGCMVLYSCLDTELQAITAGTTDANQIRWKARVRSVWNEEKLHELLIAIRGQQTAITLLIQLLQVDTLEEIKHMLSKNETTITASVHTTRSLRERNPGVRVPSSIYGVQEWNQSTSDGETNSVVAPSELDFDFDDIVLNSRAYRRAFSQARANVNDKPTEDLGDLIDFSDNRSLTQTIVQDSLTSQTLQELAGLAIQSPPSQQQTEEFANPESPGLGRDSPIPEILDVEPEKRSLESPECLPSPPPQPISSPFSKKVCFRCHERIMGMRLKLPDGRRFHPHCCFCKDCGQQLESDFFPVDNEPVTFLCERDYFRRLDLLCTRCDQGLHGRYIISRGKKYHRDHFGCSEPNCEVMFSGESDKYYEIEERAVCTLHFIAMYASRCAGCEMPILGRFVENILPFRTQQWHPKCYDIDLETEWFLDMRDLIPPSIRLLSTTSLKAKDSTDLQTTTLEEVRNAIETTEASIHQVWSVLITYHKRLHEVKKDLITSCIENDIGGVSNNIRLFIRLVCIVFDAIDLVGTQDSTQQPAGVITSTSESSDFEELKSLSIGFTGTLCHMIIPWPTASDETFDGTMESIKTLVSYAEEIIATGLKMRASLDCSTTPAGLTQCLSFLKNLDSECEENWALERYSRGLSDTSCCVCRRPMDEAGFISHSSARTLYQHVTCSPCSRCKRAKLGPVAPGEEALLAPGVIACRNCHQEMPELEWCSRIKLKLIDEIIALGKL
ncbi:hypothetical protein EDB80DRAFT_731455 [Ilyonectria destructans]|nr:hypothetical protein EDB80DRAFT_731455 [Ilyonectria destructans]